MASKEVKKYGKVVAILNEKEYRKLEGLLKENLPNHIPIEIERKGDKIKLWSKNPIVMQKALQKTRDMLKKYGTDAMSKVLPYHESSKEKKIKKIVPKVKSKIKKKKSKLQKVKKLNKNLKNK